MRRVFGGLGFLLMLTLIGAFMLKKLKQKKYYVLIENKLQSPVIFDLICNGQGERVKLGSQELIIREDLVMDIKVLEGRMPHKRVIVQKDEPSYYLKGAFVYYDGGYPDLRLRREG